MYLMNLLKYLITVIMQLGAFLSFSVRSTAHHSTIREFTTGYCAFCLSTVCSNVIPIKVSVEKEEKRHRRFLIKLVSADYIVIS